MTKPITVLLVEDHDIVREGLRRLLLEEHGFRVVGEGDNGRVAVEMTRKLRPEVVVMDLAMPLLNGLEATRQILQIAPATKVVILSAHSDPAYIDHVKAMGAAGYLIKQTSFKLLAAAIREIMSGASFFCPECETSTKSKTVDAGRKPFTAQSRILTSRETEVLQLIAEGHMNKEIASELGISIKTVEKHRQKLMDKLRIHESAGLTRYAINSGIIESSVRLKIL